MCKKELYVGCYSFGITNCNFLYMVWVPLFIIGNFVADFKLEFVINYVFHYQKDFFFHSNVKAAKEQSNQEFIRSYGEIYRLDSVLFSFTSYKDGQKWKVWFNEILESHPVKMNVLKTERK